MGHRPKVSVLCKAERAMRARGRPSPTELLLVEGRQMENVGPSVLEGLLEFGV